jgi:hypothetical protein
MGIRTGILVENSHSGVRDRTPRVFRWRTGMAARWSAATWLEIEKSLRKRMDDRDLWALKAILDGLQPATRQAVA